MFRSSTIIRELALNLTKVIFTLKHSVKLRRYLLCSCVAAYHGMACVFYAVQKKRNVSSVLLCLRHQQKNVYLSRNLFSSSLIALPFIVHVTRHPFRMKYQSIMKDKSHCAQCLLSQ